ncbi:MAG: four helix bundle protein [Caldilineaceae bacterium]|nr:four helix bundle protein [Caldilineaceae bacterium]
MAKGDDIQDRLVNFAVRIIKVCNHLPDTPAGKHIANQLMRSGTSPAPNYAEARSAESKRDFVHKLKICLKELNEAEIWLQILIRGEMLPAATLGEISKECNELCRIINASIKTSLSTT